MEYSSNAKGNLGVTLGAIGTGLSIMSNGLGLFNAAGNTNHNGCFHPVTRDELAMSQLLATKDSEIAILKADSDSERKMIEVYRQAHDEIAALRNSTSADIKQLQYEINQNRRDQDAWNASQSVVNAQMSAAITTNTNSIAGINEVLSQITQVRVPNSAVCPGWGAVTVTPA